MLLFPTPTEKVQETIPLHMASFKWVPQVGSELPLAAQVTDSPWEMKGDFYSATDGSISYQQCDDDPFYKLPIQNIRGSMYFEGAMTLAFKDMKVLVDVLIIIVIFERVAGVTTIDSKSGGFPRGTIAL